MKASSIRYSRDGGISVVEIEVGDPAPGEIQVQGAACGICSWDIATCKLGAGMPRPAPPGHEGIGYVRKVGEGVTGFEEGDRVLAGGFSTFGNYRVEGVHKIPKTLPDECWLGEPVSCVVTGMDTARLRAGDRVALLGCGFMGLIFAQLLVRSPLARLVALDIDSKKLDIAKQFGVTEAHVLSRGDNAERLQALKGADGFDVVIDTTGTQSGLDCATRLVARGGQINLFGWMKGTQATFDPSAWHVNGYTVINSAPASALRNPVPAAIRLISEGIVDLAPLISHVVGITGYAGLMEKIKAGEPGYIKGVVKL